MRGIQDLLSIGISIKEEGLSALFRSMTNQRCILIRSRLSQHDNKVILPHHDARIASSLDDAVTYVTTTPGGITLAPAGVYKMKTVMTPELAKVMVLVTRGEPSAKARSFIDFVKGSGQQYIKP